MGRQQFRCVVGAVVLSILVFVPSHTALPFDIGQKAERNEVYQEPLDLDSLVFQLPKIRATIREKYSSSLNIEGSKSGIVISGTSKDLFAKALITVKLLRKELNCRLPIEIAYFENAKLDPLYRYELSKLEKHDGTLFLADVLQTAMSEDNPLKRNPNQSRRQLNTLRSDFEEGDSVKLVDMGPVARKLGLTPTAETFSSLGRIVSISKSSFEQVIYLDVETVPLQDPSLMLDWEIFKDNGALFWPTFHAAGAFESPKETLWTTLGLSAPWKYITGWRTADQSFFLMDKKRHADVMEWVIFLNVFNEVVYRYLSFEQDAWELAFALAEKSSHYAKIPYPPRGALAEKKQDVYDLVATVQNSPDGWPALLRMDESHRINLEQQNLTSVHWLTIGLPDPGWRAFSHHEESNTFGIHDQSTIYPDDLDCDSIDVETAHLLAYNDPSRWQDCYSTTANLTRKLPVGLVPLENYPKEVKDRIGGIEKAVSLLQKLSSKRHAMASSPDEASSSDLAQDFESQKSLMHVPMAEPFLNSGAEIGAGVAESQALIVLADSGYEYPANSNQGNLGFEPESRSDSSDEKFEEELERDPSNSRALSEGTKSPGRRQTRSQIRKRKRSERRRPKSFL